jgi:pimeloyl-ACP methyl ester carboxylesterase
MDTAADVERIRQALSPNDGLVAYGASHGSQYGRAYLELYGEHVKALVLDGVVDHSIGLPTFITRNTLVCSAAYCVPTGGRSGTTPLLPLPRKPSRVRRLASPGASGTLRQSHTARPGSATALGGLLRLAIHHTGCRLSRIPT